MEKFTALGFDEHEAHMLNDAYTAITKADMWEYLRLPSTPGPEGFMFSPAIELAVINAEMTYQGHTGATYAWTMRQMESIAKGSWEGWATRMRYLKSMKQLRREEELARARSARQH